MLRIRNLQVDVAPAWFDDAVAWWSAALGGTPRETDGIYVHVDGVRAPVGVHLQRLGDGPGRFHLDLEADDVAAETARLLALGAEDLGPVLDGEPGERVLADPAGLVLCIAPAGQPQLLDDGYDDRVQLRVLLFDVPPADSRAQATFWAAALDARVRAVGPDDPEFTAVVGVEGPGGAVPMAVQRLEQGSARVHVDLHCPDPVARDAEVARLVGLGATEVARSSQWVVLRTPGGPLVCVVPDVAG